jgi:non-ribosomal peptide synthetase component F
MNQPYAEKERTYGSTAATPPTFDFARSVTPRAPAKLLRESDEGVLDWIDKHACVTPGAIALVDGDRHLTYAGLEQRATALARHLRAVGVGPETLVGLALGRSLELIVGIIGILKAGGAWLPLDLDSPPERLALILEETRLPVLVSTRTDLSKLPPFRCQALSLDQLPDESATKA